MCSLVPGHQLLLRDVLFRHTPPGTALVAHNIAITVTPGIARMDGRFAVFISRKTVKGSFVFELGMQVLFPATGKRWEQSESSRKIE